MALAVEQGRAFCLLALDRKAEAQKAIEAVIDLNPFFQPGPDDATPKICAAFRDVRRRALPGTIQQIYSRAKQAYDRTRYDEAGAGFEAVLSLLDDQDLTLDSSARADLRLVATGFADLTRAAAAPPPTPIAPASTQAPAPGAASAPSASQPPRPQSNPL